MAKRNYMNGENMENKNIHFSSEKQDWTTPQEFFDKYNEKYHFDVDLACTTDNCLCENGLYLDKGVNSLEFEWSNLRDWLWLNPPYGRGLRAWVEKAHIEAQKGAKIIMLIPSRTDTSYWHDFIFSKGYEIEFLRGRLKFGGGIDKQGNPIINPAPFPSAIIKFVRK